MSETTFKPSGPVRPGSIYISWALGKSLNLVAHSLGKTREELAETVLLGWLKHNHPAVMQWVEQREADEKAFIKNLTPSNARETKPEFVLHDLEVKDNAE